MLPLQFAPRWRTASILLLTAILVAAVLPDEWLWPYDGPDIVWLGGIDKWAHILTFAGLSIWFAGQYRSDSYWRIAIGLLVFGMLIELCQRMVGYRSAEWLDVAADAMGIALGLAIAVLGIGGWCLRLESWLAKRNA